jgi:hypothetical protein
MRTADPRSGEVIVCSHEGVTAADQLNRSPGGTKAARSRVIAVDGYDKIDTRLQPTFRRNFDQLCNALAMASSDSACRP